MENNIDEAIKEIEYARSFGTSGIVPRWQAIDTILSELETYKKIAEKLAEVLDNITEEIAREKGIDDFKFCDEKCHNEDDYIECKQCIIDWARKEVEKDE